MTWLAGWAATGGTNSAAEARLMLQASTRSGQGVVEIGDLEVTATSPASTNVTVAAGSCIIRGAEVNFQGSYSGVNAGTDTMAVPAAGASAVHHLVVARAEDPTFSGSPWDTDLASGEPIVHAVLIPNVAAGTTEVPSGTSGIPLARIDVPANTATITQAMITDLRSMIDPRSQRELRVQVGNAGGEDEAGNITDDYERWPQAEWTVTVPEWATQVQVQGIWGNVLLEADNSGTGGTHDARGQVRVTLSVDGGDSIATAAAAYNMNQTSTTNGYRASIFNMDQVAIPADMRGQEVLVHMEVKGTAGQTGRLLADDYGNFSVDMQFLEVAAPEAS